MALQKEGIPIQVVPEGTPGAAVVAVKRINELDFYSLGAKQLAKKANLTMPKAIAAVDFLTCVRTANRIRNSKSALKSTSDIRQKRLR